MKAALHRTVVFRTVVVVVTALSLSGCAALHGGDELWSGQPFTQARPHADLALAALARGEYADAELHVKAALQRNPDDVYALLAGGILYRNTGREERARQFYNHLLTLDPQEGVTVAPWTRLELRNIGDVARMHLDTIDMDRGMAAWPAPGSDAFRPVPGEGARMM